MRYEYTCPKCGRSFYLNGLSARVNCRNCGTSWNTGSGSASIEKEVMCILGGALLMPFLPSIGGLLILGGGASIWSKRG